MSFATGLIGSVVGGVASGIGSEVAGGEQAAGYENAANNANNTLNKTASGITSNENGYTSAGNGAINTLSSDLTNGTGFAKGFNLNDFYNSGGYQFNLQQGTNAINNSAAAKGGLLSGATSKSLANYASGLADTTYQNAFNNYLNQSNQQYSQLMGVANLGQTATGQVNNAQLQTGMQSAQNTYNAGVGAANATAAGTMGLANGLGSAATGGLAQYYSTLPKSSPTFTGYSSGGSLLSL